MKRAVQAGACHPLLSPVVQGQLLKLLTSLTNGKLALEIGTLGGFSGIWIARGLSSDGRLITIEYEALHADFAQKEFEQAGIAEQVRIVRGGGPGCPTRP